MGRNIKEKEKITPKNRINVLYTIHICDMSIQIESVKHMLASREPRATTPIKTSSDDDTEDPTAPFYELEAFDSIWQALHWTQIRQRVPVCAKKLLHSRYMLANLVYLGYAIGILIIDYDPSIYGTSSSDQTTLSNDTLTTTLSPSLLDQPTGSTPYVNHLYLGRSLSAGSNAILSLRCQGSV